jgi:hypothetical protein
MVEYRHLLDFRQIGVRAESDGMTTLLQGLVEQGLEMPKIHWIKT